MSYNQRFFSGLLNTYDLLEHFEKVEQPEFIKKPKPYKNTKYDAKNVFKDKRLNQLWAKAEHGGFNRELILIVVKFVFTKQILNKPNGLQSKLKFLTR